MGDGVIFTPQRHFIHARPADIFGSSPALYGLPNGEPRLDNAHGFREALVGRIQPRLYVLATLAEHVALGDSEQRGKVIIGLHDAALAVEQPDFGSHGIHLRFELFEAPRIEAMMRDIPRGGENLRVG